jgi:hypothetical protein
MTDVAPRSDQDYGDEFFRYPREVSADWRNRGELYEYQRREELARGFIQSAANVADHAAQVRVDGGIRLLRRTVKGFVKLDAEIELLTRNNPGLANALRTMESQLMLNCNEVIEGLMNRRQ